MFNLVLLGVCDGPQRTIRFARIVGHPRNSNTDSERVTHVRVVIHQDMEYAPNG